MMMMKSVFWWRKLEYLEETTDLREVNDETFHTYGLCPVRGFNLGVKDRKSYMRFHLATLSLTLSDIGRSIQITQVFNGLYLQIYSR